MKILIALAALVSSAFASISDCGTNPLFTITTLRQSPDTYVKPGDNTTLILKYNVPDAGMYIEGGTATTSLNLNGIPFSPSTEDLCTKVTCPITPGEHDGSSWTTFPSGVSGKIVSKVVWTDSKGTELLCIKSTFQASSLLKDEHKGQVNMLEGILTGKPMKKIRLSFGKALVPYVAPIEVTSSSGSNSTATGSSSSQSESTSGSSSGSSGSGSSSVKNLRGAK